MRCLWWRSSFARHVSPRAMLYGVLFPQELLLRSFLGSLFRSLIRNFFLLPGVPWLVLLLLLPLSHDVLLLLLLILHHYPLNVPPLNYFMVVLLLLQRHHLPFLLLLMCRAFSLYASPLTLFIFPLRAITFLKKNYFFFFFLKEKNLFF